MNMENFDIDSLDPKTMRLVIAIDEEGSVSNGALRVDLSQSTASYRLNKLRQFARDPIFVRGSHGTEATVVGREIIATFAAVLSQLEGLSAATEFEPGTARRDFHIAAAAPEIEAIVVPLRRHLSHVAPDCRLIVHALNTRDLPGDLREKWDMAFLSEPGPSGVLKKTRLFTDRFVTFFDRSERGPPETLDAFCAADHAIAHLGSGYRTAVDRALRAQNRSRRVKLVVNNLESLAPLMRQSDLITTLPSRLAFGLMRDFDCMPCPVALDPIPFHAVWHLQRDGAASNRWLRAQLRVLMQARRSGKA